MSDFTIEQYMKLFVHRRDVFSAQQPNGAYFPVREPITEDDIAEHLAGMASYGFYVLRPEDQTVNFIVWDLDTNEESDLNDLILHVDRFVRLAEVEGGLEEGDLPCLLLESSGRKGWHVWCLLSEPVPARQIRAWVERDFMPEWRKLNIGLEVFPKQDTVDEGGFGNLVKGPLGKHAVSGNFSQFLPCQGWAGQISEVVPLDVRLIPEAPAVVQGHERRGGNSSRSEPGAPASPFPCVDFIFTEGAPQGTRDNAMFHIALYCYGHGIPEDLALEWCGRANENFDPPMADREVQDKVRAAYRGRYQSARCGTDWLRDICPGPCRGGWQVKSAQEGDLRNCQPGDVVEVEIVRRIRDGNRDRITVQHPDAINQPTFIRGG